MYEIKAGQRIGDHYRLVRHIGSGGSSLVYEAYDSRFNRPVAIKIFKSSYLVDRGADRLRREFRIMGCMRAPFLPTYFDVGEFNGQPWLAMELVDGDSFHTRIQLGTVDYGSTLRILASVAIALDFLHNKIGPAHSDRSPIIHRDVKPGNIICSENDPYTSAVLVDFGLSKSVSDPQITEHHFIGGTASYTAPEAYMSGRDERGTESDQWSLAVAAWEGLTGISPISEAVRRFPMGLAGRSSNELLSLAEAGGNKHPIAVFEVLERGLAVNPQARYESCIAFVRDLDQALFGNDTSLMGPDNDSDGGSARGSETNETRPFSFFVDPVGGPMRPPYLETEVLSFLRPSQPDYPEGSEPFQNDGLPSGGAGCDSSIGGTQRQHFSNLGKRAESHGFRLEPERSSRSTSLGGADEVSGIVGTDDLKGVYLLEEKAELVKQVAPLAQRLRRLTAKYRESGYLE